MEKKISIQFKSAAYMILKKMPGKLWFIFGEFIDNSISSYLQNRERLEELHGKDFKLRIELSYDDDDEIRITDNAAGIDHKNWLRALQPGDIPEDDSGLNEFGMGMKYSAVWLSNHWTLKSKYIEDDFQKIVHFDYHKVIADGLEELPYQENFNRKIGHGTQLILTRLETAKVKPFQWVRIRNHIKSIYRNFIRKEHPFFSKYKIDSNIEIIAFGEKLSYEEPGFLKAQWYKDRHNLVPQSKSPEIEWKYSFDYPITNPKDNQKIRFSGFIGILPEIKQGNNGFSYFRRGRVVEGSGDEKMFPKKLSTNPGSFNYKRLFGEFHFDDTEDGKVESTFNKNSFQDKEFINFCIDSLSFEVKKINFPEAPDKEYNLLTQAGKHRSNFDPEAQKKTIKKFNEHQAKLEKDKEKQAQINERHKSLTKDVIKKDDDTPELNQGKEIPSEVKYVLRSGNTDLEFHFLLKYWESIDHDADLYTIQKGELNSFDGKNSPNKRFQSSTKFQDITLKINLKHRLFIQNESFRSETKMFGLIINMIKCIAYSELIAKSAGSKNVHFLRNTLNKTVDTFLYE